MKPHKDVTHEVFTYGNGLLKWSYQTQFSLRLSVVQIIETKSDHILFLSQAIIGDIHHRQSQAIYIIGNHRQSTYSDNSQCACTSRPFLCGYSYMRHSQRNRTIPGLFVSVLVFVVLIFIVLILRIVLNVFFHRFFICLGNHFFFQSLSFVVSFYEGCQRPERINIPYLLVPDPIEQPQSNSLKVRKSDRL